VRTIKELVALMSNHELTEIDLREGPLRIRLRRGQEPLVSTPAYQAPAVSAAPTVAAAAAPAAHAEAKPAKAHHEITSPTPGTYYWASSPEAEPFVRIGSRVTPTTVVCLIEAMKIFNEITAECAGIVTEILVENQQPVEYGQPLFRVELTS
jgi:acetyl-CoA carboxylase biotin carboxyl carrier protein